MVPKYRYISAEQADLDRDDAGAWRVLYLLNYYQETGFAHHYFPKSMELMKVIPGLSTAFFSIVEPNIHLAGHYGVFEGVMR